MLQNFLFQINTHSSHTTTAKTVAPRFEPTIPASERPQTYALDRVATGTGHDLVLLGIIVTEH
jgi:hypothetical protein